MEDINNKPEHFIDPYKNIKNHEKAIIKKHTKKAPVPLEFICRDLKIELEASELAPNISGKISLDTPRDLFRIEYNAIHPSNRQRFTIAHELGHYFLHRDCIGDGIIENALYRSKNISNWQDVEANRFAAKLLMPMELIMQEKGRAKTLYDLSKIFQVSESALRIRLGIPDNR